MQSYPVGAAENQLEDNRSGRHCLDTSNPSQHPASSLEKTRHPEIGLDIYLHEKQ